MSLSDRPIDELVVNIRKGSPEDASDICEELIRRFQPLLRKCWARLQLPVVEYQDFVQEVFVRLFQGLPALREPKAFPAYFRRIAISVMMDYFRAPERREQQQIESIESRISVADREILRDVFVWSTIERLSGRERQVLELEFRHELSLQEISQSLGITPGATRMTRSRAIKRLKRIMLAESAALERRTRSSSLQR